MTSIGRKVLVVEDDESTRQAFGRLFEAAGLECAGFDSAEALLSSTDRGGIACVISDLKLPAMSGLDLLAELRARGDQSPFILITAHDVPGLGTEALRLGAAAYLAKPFRGTRLLDLVRGLIEHDGRE